MKADLAALAAKDPTASLDSAQAKAFFAKYGSIEAVQKKLRCVAESIGCKNFMG